MPTSRNIEFSSAAKGTLPPLAMGLWSTCVALSPDPWMKLALVVPVIVAGTVWWTLLSTQRWLALFFVCLLLTPPLPVPLGDSGVHTAPLLAALGIVAGLIRMNEWRRLTSPLAATLVLFFAVLLASLSFAALYSGPDLALHSLLRVGLFGVSVYVLIWTLQGPREASFDSLSFVRLLFGLAVLATLFACADFYFQFPAPAGFEEQFVWLDDVVLRRAQGLFYEASTLGNFCAFFLTMIVVSLFHQRRDIPFPKPLLAATGLLFATALILSYSRASIIAVLAACAAFAFVRRVRVGRALTGMGIALVVAAGLVRFALPAFAANYWNRIVTSFEDVLITPDGVFTGRLASWARLRDFIAHEPWHAIFGIGYKTLPYTKLLGAEVVTDNTYLSLLVETGLIGLSVFLALNWLILRGGLRASRSGKPRAAFLGEWIFCFWVGEMVQMLSGDLITYWRVLPVYFWVLGAAIRAAEGEA